MVSCGMNAKKIKDEADLKQLADEFAMDLEMAGIESVCSESGLQELKNFLMGNQRNARTIYT
jgi:hypothetical protein